MVELDYKEMRRIALAPEKRFRGLGENRGTAKEPAIYIDNGSSVLAVAHLDYVPQTTHFRTVTIKKPKGASRTLIFNGQVDDRLGAYIILSLLPGMGIKPDVLLTTNEERGASTASLFTAPKKYNWMFQFDRSGTDVVMYQYREARYTKLLEDSGFRTGIGSYSDIADLGHLGCAGFNFGTGYYRNHDETAYAEADEIVRMVALFARFYEKNRAIEMPSTAGKRSKWGYYDAYGASAYRNERFSYSKLYDRCEVCDQMAVLNYSHALGYNVCTRCERDFASSTRAQTTTTTTEYQPCAICQEYYKSTAEDIAGLCPSCTTWYNKRVGENQR